jgi:hypothetical protein
MKMGESATAKDYVGNVSEVICICWVVLDIFQSEKLAQKVRLFFFLFFCSHLQIDYQLLPQLMWNNPNNFPLTYRALEHR